MEIGYPANRGSQRRFNILFTPRRQIPAGPSLAMEFFLDSAMYPAISIIGSRHSNWTEVQLVTAGMCLVSVPELGEWR